MWVGINSHSNLPWVTYMFLWGMCKRGKIHDTDSAPRWAITGVVSHALWLADWGCFLEQSRRMPVVCSAFIINNTWASNIITSSSLNRDAD